MAAFEYGKLARRNRKSYVENFMNGIIAEIGSVHDGSFGNACKLVEAAAACGASVVKFQAHFAQAETLRDAPSPSYFKGEPRFEYFHRTAFDKAQYLDLIALCTELSVQFLCSPFSMEAVDFLEDVGVNSYKIPSGEVSNIPLLEHLNQTNKPVILSSGMSNWKELDQAVQVLANGETLGIMQCTSAYPCPPEHVGLNIIGDMIDRYKLPVGFSDHTNGCAAAFAAAATGATFIEKHFTFSRLMYGSDAANAMEPDDFKIFTQGIKDIWAMLDSPVNKDNLTPYQDMKNIFEKSIVSASPLKAGERLTKTHFAFKKPGTGIPAARYQEFIGRSLKNDCLADCLLKEDDFL